MPRALLAAGLAVLALPAAAHHGWSGYSSDPTTLSATIESVEAIGPHATMWVRSGDRRYEIVLAPPARMSNRGLPADTLRPGQQLELMGFVHRTRGEEIRAEWIRPAGAAQPTQLR